MPALQVVKNAPPAYLPPAPELARPTTLVVGLAEEGVPIRVIARATRLPQSEVRLLLKEAIDMGELAVMPRDDWPSNQQRNARDPGLEKFEMLTDEQIIFHCHRVFGTTKLQSAFLLTLIKRKEVTREMLHRVIVQRRMIRIGSCSEDDEPSIKMVDVVVHHVRVRLERTPFKIETVWSTGYCISAKHQREMRTLLLQHMDGV